MAERKIEQICQCGDPPYVDGALCPECQQVLARDYIEQIEAGAKNPMEAYIGLLLSCPESEYEEDD